VEGTAELHDPKVRAELNQRVRECERKCFAGGRLASIQQARACARQQATREQIKSQGCVDRGSSNREQEDLEVRGGIGIANQSGSDVSSQESTTPSNSYLSSITEQDHDTWRKLVNPIIEPLRIPSPEYHRRGKVDYRRHGSREEYLSGYLPPTATLPGKLLRHLRNLVIVELFSSPILFAAGIHFSSVLLHNQGLP
jgi:hypothetical protein